MPTLALPFSGGHVDAQVVTGAKEYPLDGRVVVVNLDTSPAYLTNRPRTPIPALASTTAVDTTLEEAAAVVLLRVRDDVPSSSIVDEPGWRRFFDAAPLYRSPQADVATVRFDPVLLLEGRPTVERDFTVRLMLWFAPAGTDCGIHHEHGFIETHAQVSGHGRMQKFTADDHASLYEDVPMSPGYATPTPFCAPGPGDTFTYPWHQYRADTDCVWLAVEYHLEGR